MTCPCSVQLPIVSGVFVSTYGEPICYSQTLPSCSFYWNVSVCAKEVTRNSKEWPSTCFTARFVIAENTRKIKKTFQYT
ncbi:hypothetical protein E2C01_024312 [Portunus trituberculatus]|uniref:Uncharacterized protein n=1 Tax=Portunus trituberculatus TaxID=210409 RepID=A0A5B7ECU0_PORTR|nr:hypothetical protein [Portunus trituberculatus]